MARQRRLALVVVLVILGISGVVAVSAGGETQAQHSTVALQDAVLEETEIDADTTQMRANLHESGDARWSLTYRQHLDSESDRDAFEELATDIEADPDAYLNPFEERMLQLLETAESTTEREMAIRNLSIETERTQQPQGEFGTVTFSFEWEGFADETDGTIEAGDAIDQLILQEDEHLVMTWPDSMEMASVTPTPSVEDETQVRWEGPREFDAGQPRLTVTEVAADQPDTGGADDETAGEDILGSPFLAGFALLVLVVAALAYGWYRRNGERKDKPAAGANGPAPDGENPPPAETDTDEQSATATHVDTDLLSSEEQVLRIVNEHGGRVKQQVVTEELDWSAARTSQVVGTLRDQGKLESFRLGRENVLTVPEMSLADSPEPDDEN